MIVPDPLINVHVEDLAEALRPAILRVSRRLRQEARRREIGG